MREIDQGQFQVDDADVMGLAEMSNVVPFTPLEAQVLGVMDNMIQRSLDVSGTLRNTLSVDFGSINDKGKLVDKHFSIDGRMLGIINKMIMNRHSFYVKGDERLESAAKDIRDTRYAESQGHTLSSQELSKLWHKD